MQRMDVMETIVIQSAEAEGKEAALSAADSDLSKAEFIWTLQATWHLVNMRLEMEQAFDQPVCKKKKLWDVVSDKVNAKLSESSDTSVAVSAHECDLKWRNLLATYRKNRERVKKLGVAAVHWPFFKAMHQVLGRSRDQPQHKVEQAVTSKRFTPILPTPPPVVTASPCASRAPQDVLQLYMELQERKMNMWAQQKALEERKIDAINNLAQAIAGLAHRSGTQGHTDGQ
ncbi:uncharacterized protein si:dkey-66i24.7 isoform X1 [Synchiropus splendidus]|uniref:uncharacterized protein si:dkey-66i24.7 isoform X1 n=2 Tax=Synchiropus splendidus TaxID=270530 RepID=UPI00237EA6E9|nr:uncharacterized protein si:dkey-66i24.7 isoform X1 [Synchiropus splendidus]